MKRLDGRPKLDAVITCGRIESIRFASPTASGSDSLWHDPALGAWPTRAAWEALHLLRPELRLLPEASPANLKRITG